MNEMDPRVRSTLGQRAEQVSVTGDFAQRAIALEHRNHRRRVAAGAVGAALALAVSVPVAFSAIARETAPVLPASTTGTSVPSTTSSPTTSETAPTPTATPTTSVPATTTTPAAPTYAELRDAYAVGDTLRIGGRTIQLERGTLVKAFAVLEGGGVMLTSSIGNDLNEHEILDASGHTILRIDAPTSDAPGQIARWAVSPDGRRILFSTGQRATVLDTSGKLVAARSSTGQASAIVGDRAYFWGDVFNPSSPSMEWNFVTGTTRELPPGVRAVSHDGRLAAIHWKPAQYDDDHRSCWAIIDLENGLRRTVEKCGGNFTPESFSASGTYVTGWDYLDSGDVSNRVVVRAVDGAYVVGGGSDKEKWVLGWTMRMSEDEKSLLMARNTSPVGADRPTEVVLVRCSLDLDCTTVEPERSFTTIGSPPYAVGR